MLLFLLCESFSDSIPLLKKEWCLGTGGTGGIASFSASKALPLDSSASPKALEDLEGGGEDEIDILWVFELVDRVYPWYSDMLTLDGVRLRDPEDFLFSLLVLCELSGLVMISNSPTKTSKDFSDVETARDLDRNDAGKLFLETPEDCSLSFSLSFEAESPSRGCCKCR